MNWYILAALLIVYPSFGLSIYFVRNRLFKSKNIGTTALLPAFVSFVLGVGFLIFAIFYH